jgi:hypothetical protein
MGQDKEIGGKKKETQHFPHAQVIACPHAKIVEPVLKIAKLVLSSTLLEH